MKKYTNLYSIYMLAVVMVIAAIGLVVIKNQPLNDCERLNGIAPGVSQVIVVKSTGGFKAQITACAVHNTSWQPVFKSPFPAVVGKNGVTSADTKQEGDLKTPMGLYPLTTAFGTTPLALKMDFKYITADDKYIDDVSNKDYNTWVSGQTTAQHYESMTHVLYKAGLIINYNMNPTIAGKGSAIFMHIWPASDKPTAGCVALSEPNLITLLHWLDKKNHPHMFITS